MRTKEELMTQYLPKWPQCIVTGTKISEEQALEIIRRTDKFFNAPMYANDRNILEQIMRILAIPISPKHKEDNETYEEFNKRFQKYWDDIREWQEKWGYVFLQYLYNDWVLCDMAQGAQGWCNPDGTIDYHWNIGKWPETQEVLDELELIASTWPFLELECTLMSKEYGEEGSEPIISFLVRNGKVEVVDPLERDLRKEFNRPTWNYDETEATSKLYKLIGGMGSDSAISLDTIKSWRSHLK